MTASAEALKLLGYKQALDTIKRKLSLAGIPVDGSVIRMTEQARNELVRLRVERAALWLICKTFAREALEKDGLGRLTDD